MTRTEANDRKIKIKTRTNPRREKTAAHKYYDAMAKCKTVGEYLGKFKGKNRRDALLWLNASTRQGHVEIRA